MTLSRADCASGIGCRSRRKDLLSTLLRVVLIRYNVLMEPAPTSKLPSEAEMASYGPAQFVALVQTLGATIQSLQRQLEWFQRQMFGTKSERLRVLESAQQLALGRGTCRPVTDGACPGAPRSGP